MFGITHFVFFVAALFLLNITPGPDTAYIVGRSVAQGRGAGLMSALGISAGCCVHSLACAFGLTALLAASPAVFIVIKFAGAIYLVYLGARLIFTKPAAAQAVPVVPMAKRTKTARATQTAWLTSTAPTVPIAPATSARNETHAVSAISSTPRSLRRLFVQGVCTNVLNPKVVLFFVSFFPQFVRIDSPHKVLAFLTLGAVFVAMSTVWNSFLAWIAGSVTQRFSSRPYVKKWLDRTVGSAFVGLGIKLATTTR